MQYPVKIILFISIINFAHAQYEGDGCTLNHNKEAGVCKNSRNCPKVIQLYHQGVRFTTCSYISGQHIVCCPLEVSNVAANPNPQSVNFPDPSSTDRVSVQKCKEYKSKVTNVFTFATLVAFPAVSQEVSEETCVQSTGLIVGGLKTQIGEFPHMAALGVRKVPYQGSESIKFICGGALISEAFVLTAAHCNQYDSNESPFVRLGVKNIKNQVNEQRAIDIAVAEFIKHEQYHKRTRQNDIALLRLSSYVKFSSLVRPACLWQSYQLFEPKAIATGWGNTEWAGTPSDELLKVQLSILKPNICKQAFDDGEVVFGRNQICAGVLQGDSDTCQGDSGGPLQIFLPGSKCIYSIIGITSYGVGCGAKNSPSAYTLVSAYIDWIESIVWKS